MSTETSPKRSWLEIVRSQLRRICEVIAARRELDFKTDGELAPIAGELGIGVVELRELSRRGSHAARELPQMMTALGMDAGVIARRNPTVMLELRRVCAFCDSKAWCRRELAGENVAAHFEKFCPNRMTLRAMQ